MPNHHHSHRDWTAFDYERSERMARDYIPLEPVLEAMNLQPSDIIVDAACGSGLFSVLFSSRVRKVLSIDSNSEALKYLEKKIHDQNIMNITMWSENLCTTIPVDGNKVFIANAFHDLDCREQFLDHFISSLNRPDFIFIEMRKDAPLGPPPEIKISEGELDQYMNSRGYILDFSRPLEYHYIHRYVSQK